MIVFKNLKTGETKNAFSLREDGEKTYVRFSSGEKEYGYSKHNIEIITAENVRCSWPKVNISSESPYVTAITLVA